MAGLHKLNRSLFELSVFYRLDYMSDRASVQGNGARSR